MTAARNAHLTPASHTADFAAHFIDTPPGIFPIHGVQVRVRWPAKSFHVRALSCGKSAEPFSTPITCQHMDCTGIHNTMQ